MKMNTMNMIKNQTIAQTVIAVLVRVVAIHMTGMKRTIKISQWAVIIRTIRPFMIRERIKHIAMKMMKTTVKSIQTVVIVVVAIKRRDTIRNKSLININQVVKARKIVS